MNTQTYIAEVDPYFAEMHDIVTEGGNTDKRAWFALELAMSDLDSNGLPADTAMYIMNEYVGSTKFRNYAHLVEMLAEWDFLNEGDVTFLNSDFIMSDDVICHCDACAAKPFIG
jgi:hypothetical protein